MPNWQLDRLVPVSSAQASNSQWLFATWLPHLDDGGFMPLAIAFDKPCVLTVRASGHVTFAEVQSLMDELVRDERMSPGIHVFADCRDIQKTLSTKELQAVSRNMRPLLDRGMGPIAIVTSSTFIYGVARMFSFFAEAMGASVHAFRSADEASNWLSAQTSHAA